MKSISSAVGEPSFQRQTAAPIEYPDLGSRVYLGHVPASLTESLADLYSSFYCLLEFFELFDRPDNLNACVLDDPQHVVVFTRRGRDVVILNRLFDIDGIAARRVCASILRALPNVRRLRIDGFKIDPAEMGLPFRTLSTTIDMAMPLPSSLEDYGRWLGKSTRSNLRNYRNRLSKTMPEVTFEVREGSAIGDDLVRQVVAFNHARMRAKGKTSGIDEPYENRLGKMLAGYGFAGMLKVQKKVIAGTLSTRVGESYYLHVQAFDQPFAELHPGIVCTYLSVCAAVERGGLDFHFLWGNSLYKRANSEEGRSMSTMHPSIATDSREVWPGLRSRG